MQTDEDIVMESNPGLPTSSSGSSLSSTDKVSLADSMNAISTGLAWEFRLENPEDDTWRRFLIPDVLSQLTAELSKTSSKWKFIPPSSNVESIQTVMGFTEEVLNEWKAGMLKGVKEKDWTALINLVKLQNPTAPNVAQGVPIELQDAVIRAWKQEYYGDAPKILIRAMDDLHMLPIGLNYAKIMPIVQSSGTGKSKSVEMVGMERILLPLCLREELGENVFDQLVQKELFLEEKKRSYVCIAQAFHDFFSDPLKRSEFYAGVVAKAKLEGSNHVTVWECFERLITGLEQRCSNWPNTKMICPLFISIDEVHVLYSDHTRDANSKYTLYSHFKSVLNEGVSLGFGVMCMSTVSDAASIAPSRETTASLRGKHRDRILPAPFTELPFDVYVIADPLFPGKENLHSVGTFAFTAKFGRPLFYATYMSRKMEPKVRVVEEIMSVIQEKLSGRPWPPIAPAELDASSIAILSARLLLDLAPATVSAKRFETEMVRNHLRMLYSVHPDRDTIVTGSSPEPLIAEAAARFIHHNLENGAPYMNLWDLLEKYIDHGLAAQGDIGELIGRALSISAMDRAINNLSDARICELKYQTPVTVTDYYKAFLTPEAWERLRKSIPANHSQLSSDSGKKSFEDAFKNAYFHFSHYGKANDTSPIQDLAAWAYWLRGTAIFCQLNQDLTDRMTPIYFPAYGGVSPKSISTNLDQDKTGEKMNPVDVAIQSAKALSIFSGGNRLPYISAVHCYALTENQGISITNPPEHFPRNKRVDQVAPRYQIDFLGLASYANITDGQKATIRGAINRSKNAVFEKHSRKFGVPSLRRMLPLLGKDPASTEWFGGYEQAGKWNMNSEVIENIEKL